MTTLINLITALVATTCSLATERALRFDEAVAQILRRSTSLGLQQTSADSAAAQRISAAMSFTPTLTAEGKESTSKLGTSASAAASRQIEGTATLNILRFGADFANLMAADDLVESQRLLVEAKTLSVEDSAVRALLDAIERRKELGLYKQISDSQQELLLIAQQRYARGLLPVQEVDKLTIDLANAQARAKDAGIRETEARFALANLLGDSDVEADWPWEQRLRGAKTDPTLREPYSETKIPSWGAAKAKLSAQENLVSRDLRLFLPSIDSSFSYGYYKTALSSSAQPGWTGTISFTWPIFSGYKDFTTYRVQVYAREAAAIALEQSARDARAEWQTSKYSFDLALSTAIARDRTVELSRKAYQGNYARFKSGRLSANELFVDRARMFESELLAVQGWAAAHLAYMRLYHALGRRLTNL